MSDYKDREGNPITIWKLVRTEPEWAANVIESLRQQLEEVTRERDELIERLKPKEKRLEFDPALLEDSGEDK